MASKNIVIDEIEKLLNDNIRFLYNGDVLGNVAETSKIRLSSKGFSIEVGVDDNEDDFHFSFAIDELATLDHKGTITALTLPDITDPADMAVKRQAIFNQLTSDFFRDVQATFDPVIVNKEEPTGPDVAIVGSPFDSGDTVVIGATDIKDSADVVIGSVSYEDAIKITSHASGDITITQNGEVVEVSVSGGGGGSFLLDGITPKPIMVISFEQLMTCNTPCVRLRRSSDSEEEDIPWVAGRISASAVTTFLGVDTGYVVKKYDQSGHGNHLVYGNTSYQPIVATSLADASYLAAEYSSDVGVCDTGEDLPGGYFDRNIFEEFAVSRKNDTAFSVLHGAQDSTTASSSATWSNFMDDAQNRFRLNNTYTSITLSPIIEDENAYSHCYRTGPTATLEGEVEGAGQNETSSLASQGDLSKMKYLLLGAATSNVGNAFNGQIYTFIRYHDNLSSGDRATIKAHMVAEYNVTGP